MPKFPPSIARLIGQFMKLPGIGPKTAERLVFYLLKQPEDAILEFARSLEALTSAITHCSLCFNISESNPCSICADGKRNAKLLCVVAQSFDLMALEHTREYDGLYHVLGGYLSPLEGITPDQLRVAELIHRVKTQKLSEVIFALNPDMEGESTVIYLAKLLKPLGVKTSRLARGLPMGGNLEYADEITLGNAMRGRQEV